MQQPIVMMLTNIFNWYVTMQANIFNSDRE